MAIANSVNNTLTNVTLNSATLGSDLDVNGNDITGLAQLSLSDQLISPLIVAQDTTDTIAGTVRLYEKSGNGSNYIDLKTADALAGTYTVRMPSASDTLVGLATADTLTNKTLDDVILTGSASCEQVDVNDALRILSGTNGYVAHTSYYGDPNIGVVLRIDVQAPATVAVGGTLTLPDTTDVFVCKNTTDTLTNKTISASTNTLTGVCLTANNLSDVTAATARTNLGLAIGSNVQAYSAVLASLVTAGTTSPTTATYIPFVEGTNNGSNFTLLFGANNMGGNRFISLPDASGEVAVYQGGEQLVAAGAVSILINSTILDLVGSGAITLAAPTRAGMNKSIKMTTDNGDVTLDLSNCVGGTATTTATFGAVGDTLMLVSDRASGGKWVIIKEIGVVLT